MYRLSTLQISSALCFQGFSTWSNTEERESSLKPRSALESKWQPASFSCRSFVCFIFCEFLNSCIILRRAVLFRNYSTVWWCSISYTGFWQGHCLDQTFQNPLQLHCWSTQGKAIVMKDLSKRNLKHQKTLKASEHWKPSIDLLDICMIFACICLMGVTGWNYVIC